MKLFIKWKQIHRLRKTNGHQRKKVEGINFEFGVDIHTFFIFKIYNEQRPTF